MAQAVHQSGQMRRGASGGGRASDSIAVAGQRPARWGWAIRRKSLEGEGGADPLVVGLSAEMSEGD